GFGRFGSAEQTGRRRARHHREHSESTPRAGDAENAGQLSSRFGENDRQAPSECGHEPIDEFWLEKCTDLTAASVWPQTQLSTVLGVVTYPTSTVVCRS